jgi:hypothetical protein
MSRLPQLFFQEDESEVYDKLADPEGTKKDRVAGDTQQVRTCVI